MKTTRSFLRVVGKLLRFALAVAWLLGVDVTATEEPFFDVLRTRTATYTNATVTTKADSYIFVLHSRGMTSIRIDELPLEVKQQLGYAPPPSPPAQRVAEITAMARDLNGINAKFKPLQDTWKKHLGAGLPNAKSSSEILLTMLLIAVAFHLFVSYCFHLICLKAHNPAGFLIWVPVLQIFPLLRAAGMSGWWFLGYFVPILNIITYVRWCLKIADARGKSVLVGIMLILPFTNMLAFLYLAFSSAAPLELPPPRYRSMTLETA